MTRVASSATRSLRLFHVLKLASSLCTQLAALYLVYVLTPAEYGHFALIASVAQLMFILTSGWSSGAIITLGSRSFSRTGSYIAVVYYRLCVVGLSFLFVFAIFMVFRPWIADYMKINGMYGYMLVLFLGYVFYDYAAQLLYPGDRDRLQAGAEFAATLSLLLIVSLVVRDLKDYIFAYSIVSLVFAIFVTACFIKFFRVQRFDWQTKEFTGVLNYSCWQILGVIGIYLVNMGTNYILAARDVPLEEIGIYSFAYRLYSGFAPFFALFGILIPKWVNSSSVGLHALGGRIAKIICFLAFIYLAIGVALLGVLPILGMQRYADSVEYYFMLFPAFLFTSYANLINTIIANTARFRKAQAGILLQCALLLALGFPLVSRYGVIGIVVATTVACAAAALFYYRLYRETLLAERG